MKASNPIICVDFDGVIHSYKSGWRGVAVIPDPPVPGAIEWLECHLPVPDCVCAMKPPHEGPIVQIYCTILPCGGDFDKMRLSFLDAALCRGGVFLFHTTPLPGLAFSNSGLYPSHYFALNPGGCSGTYLDWAGEGWVTVNATAAFPSAGFHLGKLQKMIILGLLCHVSVPLRFSVDSWLGWAVYLPN